MKKSILLVALMTTIATLATNKSVEKDNVYVVENNISNKTVMYEIKVWVNSELVFEDRGCAYPSWLEAEKEYLQKKYNTSSVYVTIEHSPYDCALQ
ncbi:hypothetical protein [Myroides marinus]|uniref:KTSC domain-containing protein n=1 Tax=Myroides marinus TaxID=703342 RepID=A0A1H6XXN4_9FLAO|nr:hypothetical protein [Myroides marinus]MDM1380727.1 hypothetical protein [Myroides marinus]MDM1388016.1 hypothetical protein [Myroides marinus]MDM1395228.1 hypothetical protein [Myroides marinus]SEJ29642.1 hypothetical protein SAMN04488018_12248 [Myroides marinus]